MRGNRLQRNLAAASRFLALLVLAGCSESATHGPTDPEPVPPLAASLSPTADTVQIGQTVDFTVEITGGDPNAEPTWTCASGDAMVASATATAAGCSATGTGIGTTTIAVTVTRGAATATVSASFRVSTPPLAASISPPADTVQIGHTVDFTVEITGGDPSAEPSWTCASATQRSRRPPQRPPAALLRAPMSAPPSSRQPSREAPSRPPLPPVSR